MNVSGLRDYKINLSVSSIALGGSLVGSCIGGAVLIGSGAALQALPIAGIVVGIALIIFGSWMIYQARKQVEARKLTERSVEILPPQKIPAAVQPREIQTSSDGLSSFFLRKHGRGWIAPASACALATLGVKNLLSHRNPPSLDPLSDKGRDETDLLTDLNGVNRTIPLDSSTSFSHSFLNATPSTNLSKDYLNHASIQGAMDLGVKNLFSHRNPPSLDPLPDKGRNETDLLTDLNGVNRTTPLDSSTSFSHSFLNATPSTNLSKDYLNHASIQGAMDAELATASPQPDTFFPYSKAGVPMATWVAFGVTAAPLAAALGCLTLNKDRAIIASSNAISTALKVPYAAVRVFEKTALFAATSFLSSSFEGTFLPQPPNLPLTASIQPYFGPAPHPQKASLHLPQLSPFFPSYLSSSSLSPIFWTPLAGKLSRFLNGINRMAIESHPDRNMRTDFLRKIWGDYLDFRASW
jgi:hypothetical protein